MLNFKPETFSSGFLNESRFISESGKYAIAKYRYYRHMPCPEYFVAYERSSGRRLTTMEKPNYLQAVAACISHNKGEL